jgi:putative zinc finger/helix-turn-helix YgiT family protein
MNCPNDHGPMQLKSVTKELLFRGKKVKFRPQHYVCPVCGIEADDLGLAAANQKALSDAYRASARLLTSAQIIEGRGKRRWTQEDLARAANVGIASIKRWETGQIQTKAMDDVLRRALSGEAACGDPYTGNRPLSLDRIKLVLERFSRLLARQLLKSPVDKMLYAAKYLWYADMVAFRELGQSMTGATYAALPYGPQLNNYSELVDLIRGADETHAEPLSEREERILIRIARAFPGDQAVYRAAHKERAYKARTSGELIPYTEAESITGV